MKIVQTIGPYPVWHHVPDPPPLDEALEEVLRSFGLGGKP